MNAFLSFRLQIALLIVALFVLLVLTIWPAADLAVSRALTDGKGNFIATEMGFPVVMSAVLRHLMETTAILSILYTIWLWISRAAKDWRYCWTYLAGSFLIGPGIIVNLVLKENVGRARPATVTQFGGESHFSAAFQISDQCQTNCSFSSGEAALAATLSFTIVSLLWGGLSRRGRGWALLAGGLFLVTGAGLRVLLGRHFASDVLVSVIIAAIVTLSLYQVLGIAAARSAFAPAMLRARLKALLWRG